jgi:predicted Zn-dependent protease with MMP-like domain
MTERTLTARLARSQCAERLSIPILFASLALGSFGSRMLLAGQARVALLAAVPAVAGMMLCTSVGAADVVDEVDETGKGEVARLSHEEFDRLVERIELTARARPVTSATQDDDFAGLVRDALEELPDYLQTCLADNVAVLVADDGSVRNHYGLYHGATVAYPGHHSQVIVIYRDTLMRDFGHDPDELRRQVVTTVRHEVAHHLGASERRVGELGL